MFPVMSASKVNFNLSVKSASSNRLRAKGEYHSTALVEGDKIEDHLENDSARQTRRSTERIINRGKVSRSSSPRDKSSSVYRCFVNHEYHDHSQDQEDETQNTACMDGESTKNESHHHVRGGPRGGVSTPFPEKLHEMLGKAESEMFDNIVSWHPHGRSFAVHEPKRFVNEIMPQFFKQSKLTSFQRQLNLYGFSRLTAGPDRGGYYHELFLKGRFHLCKRMIRTRVKGTGVKAAASPSTEPNFYDMEPCVDECDQSYQEQSIRCLPVVKSSVILPRDASENVWMLPTSIRDAASSLENQSSNDSDEETDSLQSTPMKSLPDSTPSAPWSPQAVISELEDTIAKMSNDQPNRCSSPMEALFESNVDDFTSPCHSGDEVVFEGQKFHYLDTDFFLKDGESSVLHTSCDVPFMADCTSSIVDWQVDDMLGELSIYA